MKPPVRPVYLNLARIHLPLPGWVSILHRLSGALLFLLFPLMVWAFAGTLQDETAYAHWAAWLGRPSMKIGMLLVIWALAHHLFAGLRHLALDLHWGVARVAARRSSWAVLVSSALVMLGSAWGLFR